MASIALTSPIRNERGVQIEPGAAAKRLQDSPWISKVSSSIRARSTFEFRRGMPSGPIAEWKASGIAD